MNYGRFCEGCGSKMPPFFPRHRDSEGSLVCPTCLEKRTAAQNAAAGHYLRHQAMPFDDNIEMWNRDSDQTVFLSDTNMEPIFYMPSNSFMWPVDKANEAVQSKRQDDGWRYPAREVIPQSHSKIVWGPVHGAEYQAWQFRLSSKVAHDSVDRETIFHCPFCGGGQVIGRSDGTAECQFCGTAFTVQIQPQQSAQPQTIEGEPHLIPDMPEDSVAGEEMELDPEDTEIDMDDLGTDPSAKDNPFVEKKPNPFMSYRTSRGADLFEDDYIRHLAIRHAVDRDHVITEVRAALKEG